MLHSQTEQTLPQDFNPALVENSITFHLPTLVQIVKGICYILFYYHSLYSFSISHFLDELNKRKIEQLRPGVESLLVSQMFANELAAVEFARNTNDLLFLLQCGIVNSLKNADFFYLTNGTGGIQGMVLASQIDNDGY